MSLNVVFLGCTQRYGRMFSACNSKVSFMAKGLIENGATCIVHNGLSGDSSIAADELITKDGIAVCTYKRKKHWLLSALLNFKKLIVDLRKWHDAERNNVVILEAPFIAIYYLDIIAARKAGYKIVVISHEWVASFEKKNILRKIDLGLYSKSFGLFVDAILPISEYIIERISKFNKPFLKVPIEADYKIPPYRGERQRYFLYCVSAEYFRSIKVVLEGFEAHLKHYPTSSFKLVLSGSDAAKLKVMHLIDDLKIADRVEVLSNLPYSQLFEYYQKSSGLIVPLDPNYEQDKARFSQKIAEYLSSGTVIISNRVGEIGYYFSDRINIIMDDYSPLGFANSMSWVIDYPEEAANVGLSGYCLGKEKFDFSLCGKVLYDFLMKL